MNKMAKQTKENQNALAELQMLQQRMQVFVAQKQQFQLQMLEVENALREVSASKGQAYKLIGELLVEKNAQELKKELEEKQKELDLRINAIEKQEKAIKDKSLELQKTVSESLKKE